MSGLIVCTVTTLDTYYTNGAARIEAQCAELGLRVCMRRLPYEANGIGDIRMAVYQHLVANMVDCLTAYSMPCLLIGCDDELLGVPDLPEGVDVGVWHNPERGMISTHLGLAPQVVIWPTVKGVTFGALWYRIMCAHNTNDHRALCAAHALSAGLQTVFADITEAMQGCIKRNVRAKPTKNCGGNR